MTFPARVATVASTISLVRVVLSVLAAPFYVLGFVAGVAWLAVSWAFGAVLVGMADVKAKGAPVDGAR